MKQNLEILRLEELVADLRQDKMLRDMTIERMSAEMVDLRLKLAESELRLIHYRKLVNCTRTEERLQS